MKRIKRTLAALLTVVLTLALLGEAVFADNSEQPVWPEEGAIQLSKSAAAVEGKENTWEVTLGIQGKNYKTTSDVVLVIANSNSMYPSKTSKEDRMTKTKAAANAFVDTLLTEDSTTRIALVVYNLEETHTKFYTYENKAALKSKINAIEQDNCAKALAMRSDAELDACLENLLAWLRDMNWPGAFLILERLQAFQNSAALHRAIAGSLLCAQALGDEVWEENLRKLQNCENTIST